ncbi:MAG: hypothetical protein LBP92_15385 [Deltaproteobacteria bacterium]|nr:hypothetical protein [Deltaproteobacteria bacterium]
MPRRDENLADQPVFGPEELRELDLAIHLAADLVSEASGLDFGDFRQCPVDVRHFPQLGPEERRGDVLAQLFRYARQDALPRGGRPDFWRVCLYDPVILAARARESLDLGPLLCYVLTHEFVHVSRFLRFMEFFGLDQEARAREEEIVHAQTRDLLAPRALAGLGPVLGLFGERRLTLDGNPAGLVAP